MELSQYFLETVAKEKSKFIRCIAVSVIDFREKLTSYSTRVIGLGSLVPSVQEHIFSMGTIAQTYQQMYIDMLHCQPVTCAWSGAVHPAWNVKPNVVIADVRKKMNGS